MHNIEEDIEQISRTKIASTSPVRSRYLLIGVVSSVVLLTLVTVGFYLRKQKTTSLKNQSSVTQQQPVSASASEVIAADGLYEKKSISGKTLWKIEYPLAQKGLFFEGYNLPADTGNTFADVLSSNLEKSLRTEDDYLLELNTIACGFFGDNPNESKDLLLGMGANETGTPGTAKITGYTTRKIGPHSVTFFTEADSNNINGLIYANDFGINLQYKAKNAIVVEPIIASIKLFDESCDDYLKALRSLGR